MDIKEIIKKEIIELESESLKKFFSRHLLETFENMESHIDERMENIEKKVDESQNVNKFSHEICMAVMNETEYRVNENIFSPLDINDFAEKINNNTAIDIGDILVSKKGVISTVYIKLDEKMENSMINRKFSGYVKVGNERHPITVRVEKTEKYNKMIEKMFYIFEKNGIEWRTVNSFYTDDFYNIVLEDYRTEYLRFKDIKEIAYDLEDFSGFMKKDYFLVWNINRLMVNSEDFPIPNGNEIIYKYILNYNRNRAFLVDSASENEFFSIYRDDSGNINILSKERQDLMWEVWEFMDFKNIKYEKDMGFKLYSNKKRENKIFEKVNKLRTKAEINRFFSLYETLDGITLDDIIPSSRYKGNKEYLKLKKLNSFIKFDLDFDDSLKEEIVLIISSTKNREETRKIMEFLVSELEYIHYYYNFKVVLKNV